MENFKTSDIWGNFPLQIALYNKKFILPGCNRIRVAHLMGLTANSKYWGWQGYIVYPMLARMAHKRSNNYAG